MTRELKLSWRLELLWGITLPRLWDGRGHGRVMLTRVMDPTGKVILGFLVFHLCFGLDHSLRWDGRLFIPWTSNGALNEKLSFYKCAVIRTGSSLLFVTWLWLPACSCLSDNHTGVQASCWGLETSLQIIFQSSSIAQFKNHALWIIYNSSSP